MVVLALTIKEHTILYVENIMKKKQAKKPSKKTITTYFEELSQYKPVSDTKGKGQVKGRDIERIQDYLENK